MSRLSSIVRFFAAAAVLAAAIAFPGTSTPNLQAYAQSSTPAQQPVPAQPPATNPPGPSATPAAEPAPAAAPDAAQQPAQAPAAQAPVAKPPAAAKPAAKQKPKAPPPPSPINEEEIKRMLVGKQLYLRGGYQDNTLSFNELGALVGQSPQGSFTLSGIQIEKVRLTKHRLELEGSRYGLRFLGATPYEDPTKADVGRVNITPKKKPVKITIDREVMVSPKLGVPWKHEKHDKKNAGSAVPGNSGQAAPASPAASQPGEMSDADQIKAQIAAAPPEERPADPGSVTATTSIGHANKMLKDALDRVFADGIDDRLMASMPAYWKLYYQAEASKTGYHPSDPAVLRQNMVDKKAKLITVFEPQSNEYAQAFGVAGVALYHAVIGADGKPGEIAVGRPIGFGLDENAVEAILKASFEPAIKDGQPVPVLLDLVVQFRIYSNRTSANSEAGKAAPTGPETPPLPGPYSVQHP